LVVELADGAVGAAGAVDAREAVGAFARGRAVAAGVAAGVVFLTDAVDAHQARRAAIRGARAGAGVRRGFRLERVQAEAVAALGPLWAVGVAHALGHAASVRADGVTRALIVAIAVGPRRGAY